MATDIEKLVVQMSADLRQYKNEMQRAQGITNTQARAIENRYRQMDKRLSSIGQSAARSLIAPLTGVAAAISVKEVLGYADAWTAAKNSLAVAGVVGSNQADVLDRLYQSAQANAAPVSALADLFGKAAQASDNLGASQDDLIKFSDGVATALKVAGTGAAQSAGALTQLGQLLGSARVQAEEFNSVNEGARPILIAVANGLDAAGGSVNKLKQLVNEGKLSGRQFFEAFIKGLPTIQSMAANSTQTIEQGLIKVNNAFTKYIGQTDESLSASQRLVGGLNALADNFDATADVVLKVAGVIAGALVGRSLALMVAKLGLATTAALRFVSALRAATTVGGLATAFGGLTAAAGPLGLVIGGAVVGSLALFSSTSGEASEAALTYAEALAEVEKRANDVAPAVDAASAAIDEKTKNKLAGGIKEGVTEIEAAKVAVLDLFDALLRNVDQDTISAQQLAQLVEFRKKLDEGTIGAEKVDQALHGLANSSPDFQAVANAFSPLLTTLAKAIAAVDLLKQKLGSASALSTKDVEAYQEYGASRSAGDQMLAAGKAYTAEAQRQNKLSKDQLAVEKEIADIRAGLAKTGGFLPDGEIAALAKANLAASEDRSQSGKGGGSKTVKATADSRFDGDIQAVRDRTAALIEEQAIVGLSYQSQEKRRMALDLEQSALADLREEARKKGETDLNSIKLSDDQTAKIEAASAAYAEQAAVLRQLEDQQQRNEQAADEFYDAFKTGAMDAITGAETLGDALSGLAKRLGDLFLSSALDSLFKPATGGEGGGLFGAIFKGIGGLFGGGIPGRAAGGPVSAGKPYVVGEKRPELFVPSQSGRIVPQVPTMAALPRPQATGPQSLKLTVNVDGARGDQHIVDLVNQGVGKGIKQFAGSGEFKARTVHAVRDARQRNVKL